MSSDAGGIDAALNAILVAMGKRLPADVPVAPQPKAEPLEELVLELTDLKFHEHDGVRRASARARLVYEPATPGQREVASAQSWRFVAPLGPIEAEELRWYLEKYAIWPSEYFRDRARKVEESLVKWGQLLHAAALPGAHTANVMKAWARIDGHAGRRFSVHVDAALEAGAPDGRRRDRPRSCHAPARPAVGASPRRRRLPFPRREADARPPAPAEYARARRAGGRHAHPHPARHRPSGGRRLRLHRSPRERAAAGRGDGRPRRPRPPPRAQPAHAARLARGARPRPPRPRAVSRRPLRWPRRL